MGLANRYRRLGDRSLYLGILESMWTFSGGLGPVMGGVFSEYATWRWNFWINLPTCALAFALLFFFLDVHYMNDLFSFHRVAAGPIAYWNELGQSNLVKMKTRCFKNRSIVEVEHAKPSIHKHKKGKRRLRKRNCMYKSNQ